MSVQIALKMCLAAKNRQKTHKNLYFCIQESSRQLTVKIWWY